MEAVGDRGPIRRIIFKGEPEMYAWTDLRAYFYMGIPESGRFVPTIVSTLRNPPEEEGDPN